MNAPETILYVRQPQMMWCGACVFSDGKGFNCTECIKCIHPNVINALNGNDWSKKAGVIALYIEQPIKCPPMWKDKSITPGVTA